MGFFSDLKEDLSQAVNELMPEDVQLEEEEALEAVTEAEYGELEQVTYEAETEENNADAAETVYDVLDADVEYETEADAAYETEEVYAEEAAEEEPVTEETDERAQLDALLDKVDTIEIPEDMDITKVEDEEPEMDLETSIREAFGEKENEEEIMGGNEKKMDYQTKSVVDETAVITASMTINGDIISEGSIDVIGTINGNIDALGKLNITGTINGNSKAAEIFADNAKIMGEVVSEGSVKIGQSSVIIGNISAQSAVIAGAVKGDIDVHGPVVLDTSAIVMGNIKSKAVQINNGAVIEGMCSQCYADVNPTAFFDEYKKKGNKDK
ncbi:MAG: polymer-forming cytoskeletal protein [Lachnospiraceae bacterium]|nr:polymer-forming cytoskeletal protein [Lachnospiraceae bacterium]